MKFKIITDSSPWLTPSTAVYTIAKTGWYHFPDGYSYKLMGGVAVPLEVDKNGNTRPRSYLERKKSFSDE